MPDISITDSLGNPVPGAKVDLSQPSSLVDYAKSQVLHLLVAPDFIERKDQALTQAAASPLRFQAKLSNAFALGATQPVVTLTPKVNAVLRANTTAGANLFDDDRFPQGAAVPAGTGLVGLALTGGLDAGIGGSAGEFTFGLTAGGSIGIEFLKAFPTGAGVPTLGEATAAMLSGYLIPVSVDDLKRMQANDLCTVTGQGSLKVSGGFRVATPVNPLASVQLPLGAGTVDVKSGAMAGVTAAFTLSGSYQIRVRRLAGGAVELSYLRAKGTRLEADFNASVSATASFNGADMLGPLMTAISKNAPDSKMLAGLKPDELKMFNAAIQEGVAHSIQASIDVVVSEATDDEAAFQYELDLDALDAASAALVNRALRGDLTGMNALEAQAAAGDRIAPGIRLLDSLLVRARTTGTTLKVNLLGIVNLVSLSKLMSNCEILFEAASGDLTIKETAQSERIAAITDQLHQQETLRKALFDSVLVTTAYRAGKATSLPGLDCHCLHFVANRGTARADIGGYLNWFATLGLVQAAERATLLEQYAGDKSSTCVLRTAFNDAACEQLFFNEAGQLRDPSYYLNFGREALRALLAPAKDVAGLARYRMLDEDLRWNAAIEAGPTPALRELVPMDPRDGAFELTLSLVIGDIYDLVWWTRSMTNAGHALQAMRQFLAGREAAGLQDDAGFQQRRDALQKTMLKVVQESRSRFDQPWGMVALYWAAGTPGTAGGQLTAGTWTLVRP